jgi:hypothetical protein
LFGVFFGTSEVSDFSAVSMAALRFPFSAPSACLYNVGIPDFLISRLNGWPVVSPVKASIFASRLTTHDSGSR